MTAENLLHYLKNPANLNDISYLELKALVVQYPYCQNLRYLLARKSKMENLPDSKRDLEIASTYSIDRPLLRRQIEFNASESDILIDENIVVNEDVLELQELQELDSIQSNLSEASLLSLAVEKDNINFSITNESNGSLSDSLLQEEIPTEIEINHTDKSTTNIIDEIMNEEEELISDENINAPSDTPSSDTAPSDQLIQELQEIEQGLDSDEFESAENRSDTGSPHEMREENQAPSSSVEQENILDAEEDVIPAMDEIMEPPAESFEDKIEVSEIIEEPVEIVLEEIMETPELIIDSVEEEVISVQEEAISDKPIESLISEPTEVIKNEIIEEIIEEPIIELVEEPAINNLEETSEEVEQIEEKNVVNILEETIAEATHPIIEQTVINIEEEIIGAPIVEEVIETPETIIVESIINNLEDNLIPSTGIPLEIELSSNDPEGLQPTPKQSFSSWLQQLKSPINNNTKETKEVVIEKTKKELKKESQKEVKNTSKKSSKKKDKKGKKGKKIKAKEIARQSIVERGDIISETLAELLAKQGYKEKAIKMYGKLSHYYPEKSTLFNTKINELLVSDDE